MRTTLGGAAAILLLAVPQARLARAEPTSHDADFTKETLYCEEALTRVETCCKEAPSTARQWALSSRGQCRDVYVHDDGRRGCESDPHQVQTTTNITPDLTLEEAECVLARSCAELRDQGACAGFDAWRCK